MTRLTKYFLLAAAIVAVPLTAMDNNKPHKDRKSALAKVLSKSETAKKLNSDLNSLAHDDEVLYEMYVNSPRIHPIGDGTPYNILVSALVDIEFSGNQSQVRKFSKIAETALKKGAPINLPTESGNLIYDAVVAESLYMLHFLITHGAIPYTFKEKNSSPLMKLADGRGDRIEMAQMLLDAEADLAFESKDGNNALAQAITSGNLGCLRLFLKYGYIEEIYTKVLAELKKIELRELTLEGLSPKEMLAKTLLYDYLEREFVRKQKLT